MATQKLELTSSPQNIIADLSLSAGTTYRGRYIHEGRPDVMYMLEGTVTPTDLEDAWPVFPGEDIRFTVDRNLFIHFWSANGKGILWLSPE